MSYERIWGTPIGQDCVTLKVALAKWLGERLVYLSYREHLDCPTGYHGGESRWQKDMLRHGQALVEYGADTGVNSEKAKAAMTWVSTYFDDLWH